MDKFRDLVSHYILSHIFDGSLPFMPVLDPSDVPYESPWEKENFERGMRFLFLSIAEQELDRCWVLTEQGLGFSPENRRKKQLVSQALMKP